MLSALLLALLLASGCGRPAKSDARVAALGVSEVASLQRRLLGAVPAERTAAQAEVRDLGEMALPVLLICLGADDPRLREWAADALGDLRLAPAAPLLVAALADRRNRPRYLRTLQPDSDHFVMTTVRDRDVQTAVLMALRRIGRPARPPLRALRERARQTRDPELAAAASLALALTGERNVNTTISMAGD